MLAGPGEVTGLQAESAILQVSSTDTDRVNALGAKLRVRWLTAELEFSLLAVGGTLGPSMRTLVPGGPRDTYATMILRRKALSDERYWHPEHNVSIELV